MEAILRFNLPKDSEEFAVMSKAQDLYFVVYDLEQYLRSELKYKELDEATYEAYESIRDKLYDILEYHGCSLDMMS